MSEPRISSRGQISVYLGKCFRMFIYQSDWKFLPMTALIAGVVALVVGGNMFYTSVSFGLNKGKNNGMSKAAMAKEMNALKKDNADLKRAMSAMAAKLGSLSLISGKRAEFPDVPKDHWANKAVETLHGNGFVQGYPDGEFKGDRKMSRYEYAEMLYNALERGAEVNVEHLNEYAPELEQVYANRRKK